MARRVRVFDYKNNSFYKQNWGDEKWRNEYFSKFMTVDEHNGGPGLVRNSKFGFYKSLDFEDAIESPDKVLKKLEYDGKMNGVISVEFEILEIKKLKLMTLVKVKL